MINVAVIGCGYWGPNLIRNFFENTDCSLRWCCDLRASRLKLIRRKYPAVKLTTDYKDIIKDKKIDAIAIATPLAAHYSIAKEALLAGKYVLVEKPFVESTKKSEELINLARKKYLLLMVGYTYLYSPSIIKIGDILSSNEIGTLCYINSIRVHFGHVRPKESVVWDLASHDLAIIFSWLKSSEYTISCFGRDCLKRGNLDTAYLNINFKRGPGVCIFISWLAPIKTRNMILTGRKKMIFFDDIENVEKIKIYNQSAVVKKSKLFGENPLIYKTGNVSSPQIDIYEPLSAEIDDFIRSIKSGRKPKSDGLFGLQVVKALEAVDRSLKSRKEIRVKR